MDRLELAVIVVSYNTREMLRGCLRSIFSSNLGGIMLSVVVVDNASHDGSPDMVRADFPQVCLLEPGENLGFTAANNLALRTLGFPMDPSPHQSTSSSTDYVFLLNPDTDLPPGSLALMVAFLESNPTVGGCGAHLRYGDGRFQHGAFHFPTLAQVLMDLLPVHKVPGGHRLLDSGLNGRYPQGLWNGGVPFPVDFVLGAALLVRGEAIRQVGGLDEGFFMYCEEMDWCLRLGEAGWPVYAVPNALVFHFEGQSSKQVPWESFVRLWRSRLRFYAKHGSRYGRVHNGMLRIVIRAWLSAQRRQVQRRAARGEIDGDALSAELAAYEQVDALLSAMVEGKL